MAQEQQTAQGLSQEQIEELTILHLLVSQDKKFGKPLEQILRVADFLKVVNSMFPNTDSSTFEEEDFDGFIRRETHYFLQSVGYQWNNAKFSKNGRDLTPEQYHSAQRLTKMTFVKMVAGHMGEREKIELPWRPWSPQNDLKYFHSRANEYPEFIALARQF